MCNVANLSTQKHGVFCPFEANIKLNDEPRVCEAKNNLIVAYVIVIF